MAPDTVPPISTPSPGLGHGDFVELTAHDGIIIYGRSDAVLNPGGVRIGTAEIYRQVERIDEVLESLVIGQQWDNDVRVVLFVRLREGLRLDEGVDRRICARCDVTPRRAMSRPRSSRWRISYVPRAAKSSSWPCATWCMANR